MEETVGLVAKEVLALTKPLQQDRSDDPDKGLESPFPGRCSSSGRHCNVAASGFPLT